MLSLLILFLLIPSLLLIVYQDFKYRLISWWILPILLLLVLLGQNSQSYYQIVINSAINISFLLLQYILLSLYFSFKNKAWVKLTHQHIGWGDLWFLLIIAFAFPSLHFILIYVGGLFFSLLLYMILKSFKLLVQETVPLAGTFSIYLILLQLVAYFNEYNFLNDDGLLMKINTLYV